MGVKLIGRYNSRNILTLRYIKDEDKFISNEEVIRIYAGILEEDDYNVTHIDNAFVCKKENITIRLETRFNGILVIVQGI